jgi:hypothetical protein
VTCSGQGDVDAANIEVWRNGCGALVQPMFCFDSALATVEDEGAIATLYWKYHDYILSECRLVLVIILQLC